MGKVTIYCQLSGCTPEAEDIIEFGVFEDPVFGSQVLAALTLLTNSDETQGQQALTIIGPLADNENDWLEIEGIEEALALPQGRIRAVSGCSMGDMFDMGFCNGPEGGPEGALISYGSCFYVLTITLPILEAATCGRVSVRRLWNLSMMKGHLDAHNHDCLSGVTYGPIQKYWEQFPWMFGEMSQEDVAELNDKGDPEEIAEVIRSRAYWMWMRPDRFPIESPSTLVPYLNIIHTSPTQATSSNLITALPLEILDSLIAYLQLSDTVSLALSSRSVYGLLLGTGDARDFIAKAYMRLEARWCLPWGKAELEWWHDRDGDKALGWEYLKRCYVQSHSMRNRRRIWKAAESIEEECEREERAWASRS